MPINLNESRHLSFEYEGELIEADYSIAQDFIEDHPTRGNLAWLVIRSPAIIGHQIKSSIGVHMMTEPDQAIEEEVRNCIIGFLEF